MYIRCLFIFISFINASYSWAQEINSYTVTKSLDQEWKVYSGGQFLPYVPDGEGYPHAVYFTIEANHHQGRFLQCAANKEFSLFINHQLIEVKANGTMIFNLDSLSRKYSSHLQCVIFQNKGIDRLITNIVDTSESPSDSTIRKRKGNYFLDFSIIASLILFAYAIALIRTLPRLATNYFNVLRLLSLQEREENLAGSRVSSTANMLFYVFASLLAGLVVTVVFYYSSGITSFPFIKIDSVGIGFVQWGKWSAIIFLLLISKLILTYALSGLFNMVELVPFHFFNFLRLFFFLFGTSALLSLSYFILKGQNPEFYSSLLYIVAFLTTLWVALIYVKLLAKVPFRFFHLFSYLCTSEIIPVVIIFKILLF